MFGRFSFEHFDRTLVSGTPTLDYEPVELYASVEPLSGSPSCAIHMMTHDIGSQITMGTLQDETDNSATVKVRLKR